MIKFYIIKIPIILLLFLLLTNSVNSEELDHKAQANNPLANMQAVNLHNYYTGELTDSGEDANQLWLRYAQPFSVGESKWLLRASLPINTFPTSADGGKSSGVGDFNAFAAYLFDMGTPGVSFGIGPQITAPSASDDKLGSEQWSAGFANILFNGSSKKFQYGYLLTWQHSFAGSSERDDVNMAVFQPFAMYQLGGGTYLRAAPMWAYNIESGNYNIPLGIGIGQVIKHNKTVYNLFLEPQYSVATDGANQPQWQILLGLNIQFLK